MAQIHTETVTISNVHSMERIRTAVSLGPCGFRITHRRVRIRAISSPHQDRAAVMAVKAMRRLPRMSWTSMAHFRMDQSEVNLLGRDALFASAKALSPRPTLRNG